MNQLDYVDICPGESVLFKWNLREFRMIYAFCSTKKRYYKTFVLIINNTLMRTIIKFTSKEYVVEITKEALDLSIKREYNFQTVRSLQINCFPAKNIQNIFR